MGLSRRRRAAVSDEQPPRPSLPPLLAAGLGLWAAAAAVFPALRTASPGALALLLAAGGIGLTVAVALAVRRARLATAALLAIGLCAGLALSASGALQLQGQADRLGDGPRTWQVSLAEDARATQFGAQAEARAISEGEAVTVRLFLPRGQAGLLQGSTFEVRGALKPFSEVSRDFAWSNGLAGSLDAARLRPEAVAQPPLVQLRQRALDLIAQMAGETEGGALLQALVCGYRGPLRDQGSYPAFQQTGLAHLVAVSGAHLSLVTLFVTHALRALRLGRRSTALIIGGFLAGYLGFTGMPVSALRAALMAATGLFSFLGGRRASALNGLGLCLVAFIAQDVSCALSVSFALSAGSTLGILLFAPLFQRLFPLKSALGQGLVAGPLALTLASAVATQPLSAALFAQLPLIAPLANVLATPLFTLCCVGGFAAVSLALAFPPAAFLLGAASHGCALLLALTQALARLPFACVPASAPAPLMVLVSVGLSAALWRRWPKPRSLARAVACVLAAATALGLVAVAAAAQRDEIVMLDVGQGDAFLVRSQGHALLIDTGNQNRLLKEACARHAVAALDAVAVSHHDDDHCGSLEGLGTVARVPAVLVAAPTLTCPCASCLALVRPIARDPSQKAQGLAVGDAVSCGRFTLTVVWPERFSDEGGNGDSLSFLCQFDGNGDGAPEWSALFCGDAEAEELAAMARHLPAQGVDVLKVGHHGSRASVDDRAMEALRPKIALVSAGEGNRYGHPAPECLETLEKAGCRVLRTDLHGDVALGFTAEKIAVACQRSG